MKPSILIAYGTKRGSTQEVADTLREELGALGLAVETARAQEIDDITAYDAVIVGGALYMGRWHPDAVGFVTRHRKALATTPFAVFAMGPRTTEPRDLADARKQLDRSLERLGELKPVEIAIFGGVVDPTKLRFPLNRMPASDARDWDAIRAWAATLARHFGYGKAATNAGDPRRALQQSP